MGDIEFSPSKLDHFVGQAVEAIVSYGDESWEWAVKLESGVLVKNYDKRRTTAPETDNVVGFTFQMPIFSELDTRLKFSSGDEIVFTPTQYALADKLKGGREKFPQKPDKEEQIVEAPEPKGAAERVQDGPSEAGLALLQEDDDA